MSVVPARLAPIQHREGTGPERPVSVVQRKARRVSSPANTERVEVEMALLSHARSPRPWSRRAFGSPKEPSGEVEGRVACLLERFPAEVAPVAQRAAGGRTGSARSEPGCRSSAARVARRRRAAGRRRRGRRAGLRGAERQYRTLVEPPERRLALLLSVGACGPCSSPRGQARAPVAAGRARRATDAASARRTSVGLSPSVSQTVRNANGQSVFSLANQAMASARCLSRPATCPSFDRDRQGQTTRVRAPPP